MVFRVNIPHLEVLDGGNSSPTLWKLNQLQHEDILLGRCQIPITLLQGSLTKQGLRKIRYLTLKHISIMHI